VAVGIAGLGAVGSSVFWSLYRGWLKLDIFANLTPEQTFSLMRWFLLLTFLSLLAILATYLTSKSNEAADHTLLEGVFHQGKAYEDEVHREFALRDKIEGLNNTIAAKQEALESVQQKLATARTQLQIEELTRQNRDLRNEVDRSRNIVVATKKRLDAVQQTLSGARAGIVIDYADVLSSEPGLQSSGVSPLGGSSGSSPTLAERLSSKTVAAWDKCVRAAGNKVAGEQPNCEAILRDGLKAVIPSR
jgi:hypothetical protein